MNVLRFLTASLLTLSIVGCCTGRNVVCDSCDPCGGAPACGTGFLRSHSFKNLFGGGCLGRHKCGACSDVGCCGAPMGCPDCAAPAAFGSYMGSAPSSGCGCSQGGGSPSYDPNNAFQLPSPTPSSGSAPSPSSIAPSPPQTIAPSGEPQTMVPSSATMPVQTVTYEEFQKLPGTIISGPGVGTTTAPAASMTSMAPPTMSAPAVAAPTSMPSVGKVVGSTQRLVPRPTTNMPVAAATPGQNPVWVPVR